MNKPTSTLIDPPASPAPPVHEPLHLAAPAAFEACGGCAEAGRAAIATLWRRRWLAAAKSRDAGLVASPRREPQLTQ